VERELAAVDERRAALVAQQDERRERLSVAEKETLAARHALEGQREVAERVDDRLSGLRFEHGSADEELREARQRHEELSDRLDSHAARRRELDATLEEAQGGAERLEAETAAADASVSRLREEVAIKRERGEAARAELRPVEQRTAQVEDRLRLLEEERAALEHQRAELERTVSEAEEAIGKGHERWEQLRLDLEEAEERVRVERRDLVDGSARLRELRLEHDRRSQAAGEADVRRERAASKLEHLVDDCVKELGVRPDELEVPLPPSADAEPSAEAEEEAGAELAPAGAEVAEAPADEPDAADEPEAADDAGEEALVIDEALPWTVEGELDLAALEEEAAELRRKLANIGPVNLVAIEEYDELAERHGFLATERDDLVSSMESLRATIEEIDATSRERFVECFEVVRGNFDEAFQTLFRGGRAELRLQDEEDVLESGIEIIAQPPGKRLQNMMLLSGGEKALTAIALLFALFRYKPSPFCILDEVDAPLDEANVARFITLVEAMAEDTQFLVVTHNRRTMEQGKVLYGVTMEEAGCSKLVSVHFEGLTAAAGAA
jgi:chromosome segregation protein